MGIINSLLLACGGRRRGVDATSLKLWSTGWFKDIIHKYNFLDKIQVVHCWSFSCKSTCSKSLLQIIICVNRQPFPCSVFPLFSFLFGALQIKKATTLFYGNNTHEALPHRHCCAILKVGRETAAAGLKVDGGWNRSGRGKRVLEGRRGGGGGLRFVFA